MSSMPAFSLALCCWVILWIYWLLSAASQKAEKKRESASERMGQIIPILVCYVLLFEPFMGFGWLGLRFVPKRPELEFVGLFITALGVALAIWARAHLGANWSAAVSIRTDHELIGSGPYRYIRHPIYTGMILAAIGTALVIGQVRGLLAVGIFLVAFYGKASKEERWLTQEFADRFNAHAARTGMFLPKLR